MRTIKLIIKRIVIGILMAVAYLIIGVSVLFNMRDNSGGDAMAFLIFWLILGVVLIIFTPMRYALVITALFGIGGDWFSDIGADSSVEISMEVPPDPSGNVIDQVLEPGTQHVDTHYVSSYVRDDGTVAEGHWRDGDGNPNTTSMQGYERSAPDGNPFNNMKKG